MPRKSKPEEVAAAPESGPEAGPPAAPRPAAGSRRKQRQPHRVVSDDTDTELPPTVRQELPSSFANAATNPTAATSATSSLITALKKKRPPKEISWVECGVCKETVKEQGFQRHALSNHLGLARPVGHEQVFTKKEKLSAFGRVLRAGGKLLCPKCGKCLTSALGFFHHQDTCGKEVEPIQCPKCSFLLKPISMPYHMRKHKKEEEMGLDPQPRRKRERKKEKKDVKKERVGDDKESSDPPKKRLRKNGTTSYVETDDGADAPAAPRRGFSAPRLTPHKRTVAKWQRRLQTEDQLGCQMPGCQHQAASIEDMLSHYPQCPGLPAKWRVFSCDQCGAQADAEPDILDHIERIHRTEMLVAGPRGKPTRFRPDAILPEQAGDLTYFTPIERQFNPREQINNYFAKLPKSRVAALVGAKVSDWRRCGSDERERYLPPLKLSPAYKVQEIGNPDPYRCFERLDVFTFEELDNGVVCFCGGPVLACDWCPLPADWCDGGDADQYLAVSCLPAVDQHLSPVEPSALPSAVQVWSFTADRRSAQMEFAVCVDGGPVWDLAWCPAGHSSVPPKDHLGSLALACGDGRVRIFTIPAPNAPSALPPGDDTTGPACVVKQAEFRLEVLGDANRTPCCRLDWAHTEGNRSIAGSFGNGVVAIWNLETSSPILRQTDGATRVLYPVQLIPAHRGHGTALAFSPSSDRFLASGGRDRMLQMWDREEPFSMQRASSKPRPMLTDLCWPPATKKLITAYDHSLFVGSPSVMLLDAAMPVLDAPLFTHAAKCTSLSVNGAVNGLACGSESGVVALAQWRTMLSHKHKGEVRRLLLKLEAERLTPSAAGSGPEELLLGDKFSQLWESCGVTLWEAKMHANSSLIREGFDDHVSSSGSWVANYPFVAVNRLSWNRNRQHDAWLAVGMECGLLRVLEVPPGAFTVVRS